MFGAEAAYGFPHRAIFCGKKWKIRKREVAEKLIRVEKDAKSEEIRMKKNKWHVIFQRLFAIMLVGVMLFPAWGVNVIIRADSENVNWSNMTEDTFENTGGAYTLDYILNHYNVFSFGKVTGSHIVGAVVCRGDLYNGMDEEAGKKTNIPFGNSIIENSFSYVNGMIYATPAMSVRRIYLGTGNHISRTGNWNDNDSSEGQFHVNGNDWNYNAHQIRTTDHYVDWDAAYSGLDLQAKKLAEDPDNRKIRPEDIKNGGLYLRAGERVTVSKEVLDLITDAVYVDTTGGSGTGGLAGKQGTVINLMQYEDFSLPVLKYGEGENYGFYSSGSPGEFGAGVSIVWNVPYAAYITWKGNQGNEVGHVVAPNAVMYYEGGNYSGTMLVKELRGSAEGHMWPYTGDELVPAQKGFRAAKTIDGEAPSATQKFKFHLYELKEGSWGDRPIQTYSNNGSEIEFQEIVYTDEGVHWYLMSEDQTPQKGYVLSKELYVASVGITVNYSLRAYESDAVWYKVKDGLDRNDLIIDGEIDTSKLEEYIGNPVFHNKTEVSVKIKKVDIADQSVLRGAVLQILDGEGKVLDEWISDTEPHKVTGMKREELYILRETAAPEGYDIAADTVFRLDKNGEIDKSVTTAAVSDDGVLLVQDVKTKQKVDIDLKKLWKGFTQQELGSIQRVEFSLYLQGTRADGSNFDDLHIQTISVMPQYVNGDQIGMSWSGTFCQVPLLEEQKEEFGLTEQKYVVREKCIYYTDGNEIVCGSAEWNQRFGSGDNQDITIINTTTLNENTTDCFSDISESFQVTNAVRRTGSITVRKVDGRGDGLNGVSFMLQKAEVNGDDWKVDDIWKAQYGVTADCGSEQGVVKFEDLPEGNYLLTETSTLPGRMLLRQPVKLTIPYVMESTGDASAAAGNNTGIWIDGKTYYYDLTYTISNEQSFALPQAGTAGWNGLWRWGIAFVVITTGMLVFRKRSGQSNEDIF